MSFDEQTLEKLVMSLLRMQGYTYINGKDIERDTLKEVLLKDVLRGYLLEQYADEGITLSEVERAIALLESAIDSSDYETNKKQLDMIINGYNVPRDNRSSLPLFINPIDFKRANNQTESDSNSYVVVNQFEIQGSEKLRIPDAIIFVNGIPLVVFEFKSAIKESATIENAYEQLTVRYSRDIPKLFRSNAFVVISDGLSNKFGSIFTPYQHFYGWNKVNHDDNIQSGFNSLETLMTMKR